MSLRLSLRSGAQRRDLVLPGVVPVVELVPEVAQLLGVLNCETASARYRLVRSDGQVLETDAGLSAQGVRDGEVLTLVDGDAGPVATTYDDSAEALAGVVASVTTDGAGIRRRAAWVAIGALLPAGAVGLLLQRDSRVATSCAAWTAAALVSAAWGAGRRREGARPAAAAALLGSAYAGVAGSLAVPGGPLTARALTTAGAATLAAALVAGAGLGSRRAVLTLPAVTAGAMLVATGAAEQRLGWDAAVFVTWALGVVVIADAWSVGLAARIAGWGSGSPSVLSGEGGLEGGPVDLGRIAAEAVAAHHTMAATAASVGVALVVAAAPAVSLGAAGTATELLACLVVLLRTRHVQARAPLLAGLASGIVGVVAAVGSVMWLHPAWRQPAALGCEGTGLALLACVALPGARAGTARRLADGVEALAHVLVVPTIVVATGALSMVLRP